MKRIAYLCLSEGWGGLEMNQIRNAKAMQDRGHNVLILTLKNSATLFEAQQQNLPYYTFEKKLVCIKKAPNFRDLFYLLRC